MEPKDDLTAGMKPENVSEAAAHGYLRATGWTELPAIPKEGLPTAMWFNDAAGVSLRLAMPRGKAVLHQYRSDWARFGFLIAHSPTKMLVEFFGHIVAASLIDMWDDVKGDLAIVIENSLGPELYAKWRDSLEQGRVQAAEVLKKARDKKREEAN